MLQFLVYATGPMSQEAKGQARRATGKGFGVMYPSETSAQTLTRYSRGERGTGVLKSCYINENGFDKAYSPVARRNIVTDAGYALGPIVPRCGQTMAGPAFIRDTVCAAATEPIGTAFHCQGIELHHLSAETYSRCGSDGWCSYQADLQIR